MIKGYAVILPPNEQVWKGDDFAQPVTDEDGSEDIARQRLINAFANTVIGTVFTEIDRNDAWQFWQIAEKNGFHIRIFDRLPIVLPKPARDLQRV